MSVAELLNQYLIHENNEIHIFSSSVMSGSKEVHKALVTGQTPSTDKKRLFKKSYDSHAGNRTRAAAVRAPNPNH